MLIPMSRSDILFDVTSLSLRMGIQLLTKNEQKHDEPLYKD